MRNDTMNPVPANNVLETALAAIGRGDVAACLDLLAPDGAVPEPADLAGPSPDGTPSPDPDVPDPDPALVSALLGRFRGREDVFARQALDLRGATAWYPVRGRLTAPLIAAHLRGEVTLGVYPHRPGDSVLLAAIDLDVRPEYREMFVRDAEVRGRLEAALTRVTRDAHDRLAAKGFPSLLEDSGFKGRHLWVFFTEPAPARLVRRLLQAALSGLPLPREFTLEIFPKSDRLEPDRIGNLIKIPLGIHRGSGRRSTLLSADGAAADPLGLLGAIVAVDPATLMPPAAPGGKVVSLEAWRRSAEGGGLPGARGGDDPAASVIAGCPVIGDIAGRLERGEAVTANEAHVLIYALGVLGEAGQVACRRLLGGKPGHDELSLEEALNAVPPTAIGCVKIRKRLKGLLDDVPCDCRFDVADGVYPSPVIHAGFLPRASGGMIRPAVAAPAAVPAAVPDAASGRAVEA